MTKFSVLMANYNNAKYIAQAIDSVLHQTFNDWELIVVDDNSTDNSVAIIKKYIDDERIKFFQNNRNLGYIKTLKRLVGESRSPLLGILDSDDVLSSDAIEKIVKAYKENPECGLVYSQCYYCDEDLHTKHFGFAERIPPGKTNLELNYIHHFKTFRRKCYDKTSGYDENIKYAEDIDLNLKLEEVARPYFINKPLYYYRILPKSQTHSFLNTRINRSSTALAKLNAYKRRLGTNIPNLQKPEIAEVLFWGNLNSFLALRLGLLLKLKWNLFMIHPFFFLDHRFYRAVFRKIKKIKKLKKEKPLLGV